VTKKITGRILTFQGELVPGNSLAVPKSEVLYKREKGQRGTLRAEIGGCGGKKEVTFSGKGRKRRRGFFLGKRARGFNLGGKSCGKEG